MANALILIVKTPLYTYIHVAVYVLLPEAATTNESATLRPSPVNQFISECSARAYRCCCCCRSWRQVARTNSFYSQDKQQQNDKRVEMHITRTVVTITENKSEQHYGLARSQQREQRWWRPKATTVMTKLGTRL